MKRHDTVIHYSIVTTMIVALLLIGAGLFYGAGELAMRAALTGGRTGFFGTGVSLVLVTMAFGSWLSAVYVAIRGYR